MSAADDSDDPADSPSLDDLRSEVARVEAQRTELLRRAHDLRAQISSEGPTDAIDRATVLTEAEELEAFATELEHRRDALNDRLRDRGA
jgi:hypothetical protein